MENALAGNLTFFVFIIFVIIMIIRTFYDFKLVNDFGSILVIVNFFACCFLIFIQKWDIFFWYVIVYNTVKSMLSKFLYKKNTRINGFDPARPSLSMRFFVIVFTCFFLYAFYGLMYWLNTKGW